ncbi:MAG: hypothetical protein IJP31_00445 [Lachnospiraceae bacterium]|nr:hypothetical protein [Lachnospiraceae bacterium]
MDTHDNEFITSIQLSHLLAMEIGVMGDEATIIDTIENTEEFLTLETLPKAISALFHINMPNEKIESAVNSLLTQQKLFKDGQTLLISPQTLEDIKKIALENERIENAAWRSSSAWRRILNTCQVKTASWTISMMTGRPPVTT